MARLTMDGIAKLPTSFPVCAAEGGGMEIAMKKLLLVLASLFVTIGLCACGSGNGLFVAPTPTPIPELDPTAILSADNVYEGINYEYVPVIDGSVVTNGNSKSVVYVSNPKGLGDSVTVKITQYNESTSIDQVYQQFAAAKAKRYEITEVTELGETAYIAYPTIHVYDRGCIIEVTAGSGSDETQQQLLLNLAKTAVANFEQMMPAPVQQ